MYPLALGECRAHMWQSFTRWGHWGTKYNRYNLWARRDHTISLPPTHPPHTRLGPWYCHSRDCSPTLTAGVRCTLEFCCIPRCVLRPACNVIPFGGLLPLELHIRGIEVGGRSDVDHARRTPEENACCAGCCRGY